MPNYGLIGRKLGHSYSQRYFEQKFREWELQDCHYSLFEIDSLDGFRDRLSQWDLNGFNVTIPYKEDILPLLDSLDDVATAIGAVNCVTVKDGRLTGHNTDAPAFLQTLQHSGFDIPPSAFALILGTGGAAKAVAWALRQLGIDYLHVSRHPGQHPNAIDYNAFPITGSQIPTIIINATPVGMYPDIESTPLDLSLFRSHEVPLMVYDLIYNPSPTRLLREAAAQGAKTKDGLEMLHLQAELSWELFQQC